jgi:hypothetical protein
VSTQQRERQAQSDRAVGPIALWVGALAGPLAWTAHLLVAYFFVSVMCATGLDLLVHLTTAITIVIAAAGGFLSYRNLGRPGLTDGSRFAALGGVLLSVMFVFAIVMEGLPAFGLEPCANG